MDADFEPHQCAPDEAGGGNKYIVFRTVPFDLLPVRPQAESVGRTGNEKNSFSGMRLWHRRRLALDKFDQGGMFVV